MPNLRQYMTVKEAAEHLGVTRNTLRNWGAAGKIAEYRHPVNNYRLYKKDDLLAFLEQIESSSTMCGYSGRRKRPHAK